MRIPSSTALMHVPSGAAATAGFPFGFGRGGVAAEGSNVDRQHIGGPRHVRIILAQHGIAITSGVVIDRQGILRVVGASWLRNKEKNIDIRTSDDWTLAALKTKLTLTG
jgi:hypothetical protein